MKNHQTATTGFFLLALISISIILFFFMSEGETANQKLIYDI